VIIYQINIICVSTIELEYEAPIAGNRNSPPILAFLLEPMKLQTRQVHVSWIFGNVESCQYQPDFF